MSKILAQYETVELDKDYQPNEKEDYMCHEQRVFFYKKVAEIRTGIETENAELKLDFESLKSSYEVSEEVDFANYEAETSLILRKINENMNMVRQCQKCFSLMEQGSYGYCQSSGEPIGIQRLLANPLAILSIDNQEDMDVIDATPRGEE